MAIRWLNKWEMALNRDINNSEKHDLKSVFGIDDPNLFIGVDEVDYTNLTQKITFSYKLKNNAYLIKDTHNITEYQHMDITEYAMERIELVVQIRYFQNYPFEAPEYSVYSIKHNTKYDTLEIKKIFDSLILNFNNLYHSCDYTPATNMEKDILNFVVCYLVAMRNFTH